MINLNSRVNVQRLLENKKVLSYSDKELISEQFGVYESGIRGFAYNILDVGAGLLLSSFKTKIVGALQKAIAPYVGKQFRLPVSAFVDKVKYNNQNGVGVDEKTPQNELIKAYDEIERLIQRQMENVKSRGSVFAYLNRIHKKGNSGLSKTSLDQSKLKKVSNISFGGKEGKIFNKDGIDLFDLINKKDPKNLEKALKNVIKGDSEEAINSKIQKIIKHRESLPNDDTSDQKEGVLLKKYDINNYKNIEIGGKRYTDLRSYIIALLELSAVDKRDMDKLEKKVSSLFGNNVDIEFLGTERISTLGKGSYSWVESQLIARWLVKRFLKLLKLRDDAIMTIKAKGSSAFKTKKEKMDIRKQDIERGKISPKKPFSPEGDPNITGTKKKYSYNFIKGNNKKTPQTSSFYYKGKQITNDVVGVLEGVGLVDGSAIEYLKRLKKGWVDIDIMFSSMRIENTNISIDTKDKEGDFVESEVINAKIKISDILLFFQNIIKNTSFNLLRIIKNSSTVVDNLDPRKNKEERKPGRPSSQSKKDERMRAYNKGGFKGTDIFN